MEHLNPGNRHEVWLCSDCMQLHETGDGTAFDGNYDSKQANDRFIECSNGLDDLANQGDLFNDEFDPDEPQYECRDCYYTGSQEDFVCTAATDDEDEIVACPKCGSTDTEERDDGHLEFTWRECDACGTTLAGERHRYALFPRGKE